MGVEMGVEIVPLLQKQIIMKSHLTSFTPFLVSFPFSSLPSLSSTSSSSLLSGYVPTCVCTHMLDSMQYSFSPTRAESSDVFNAVMTGFSICNFNFD
jgi:pyruvate kinase